MSRRGWDEEEKKSISIREWALQQWAEGKTTTFQFNYTPALLNGLFWLRHWQHGRLEAGKIEANEKSIIKILASHCHVYNKYFGEEKRGECLSHASVRWPKKWNGSWQTAEECESRKLKLSDVGDHPYSEEHYWDYFRCSKCFLGVFGLRRIPIKRRYIAMGRLGIDHLHEELNYLFVLRIQALFTKQNEDSSRRGHRLSSQHVCYKWKYSLVLDVINLMRHRVYDAVCITAKLVSLSIRPCSVQTENHWRL